MEAFVSMAGAQGTLTGIFHPATGAPTPVAALVLVGGPQYRVGSHRMFVKMARQLAASGIPTLRFDFRGMGDSDGEFPGFEVLSDDVRIATDWLMSTDSAPERIVLVGLCDGASAAAMYGATDPRVSDLVLLNPWVHTEAGAARAFVWHYYPRRVMQRDFWRKLFSGKVDVTGSIAKLFGRVRAMLRRTPPGQTGEGGFVERMRRGLLTFEGRTLICLSDTDLTAAEFRNLLGESSAWAGVEEKATIRHLEQADHTLSSVAAFDQFTGACREFLGVSRSR